MVNHAQTHTKNNNEQTKTKNQINLDLIVMTSKLKCNNFKVTKEGTKCFI